MFSMFKKQVTSPTRVVKQEQGLSNDQRATFAKKFMGKLADIESQVVGIRSILFEMMRGANSAAPAVVPNVSKVPTTPAIAVPASMEKPIKAVRAKCKYHGKSYVSLQKGGVRRELVNVPIFDKESIPARSKVMSSSEFLMNKGIVASVSNSRRVSSFAASIANANGLNIETTESVHGGGVKVRAFPLYVLRASLNGLRDAGVNFERA